MRFAVVAIADKRRRRRCEMGCGKLTSAVCVMFVQRHCAMLHSMYIVFLRTSRQRLPQIRYKPTLSIKSRRGIEAPLLSTVGVDAVFRWCVVDKPESVVTHYTLHTKHKTNETPKTLCPQKRPPHVPAMLFNVSAILVANIYLEKQVW